MAANSIRSSYFNPRSSCEERRQHLRRDVECRAISIHAPHARSDDRPCRQRWRLAHFNPRSSCEERLSPSSSSTANISFQSTLLMRGATFSVVVFYRKHIILIHAPHARSDRRRLKRSGLFQISIHAPHARSDNTFVRVSLSTAVYSF